MINSIKLIDFMSSAHCWCHLYQSIDGFPQINYELKSGMTYGFISDFGRGSWGLATCLGGRSEPYCSGKVLLNEEEIFINELSKYSCFIPEHVFNGIRLESHLFTPRNCIERALAISSEPYTVEEIKKIFDLSDARFDRTMDCVSGEIWQISLAVNFALGKEIFVYPWLNERDIFRFRVACDFGLIDFLKKKGKIVIVSSSQKRVLRKYCDRTILFNQKRPCVHYR